MEDAGRVTHTPGDGRATRQVSRVTTREGKKVEKNTVGTHEWAIRGSMSVRVCACVCLCGLEMRNNDCCSITLLVM